jgi:WhiB family redox-sensing transcriptional regulator
MSRYGYVDTLGLGGSDDEPPSCVGRASLFFRDDSRSRAEAKELCGGCPIQAGCRAGAIARHEEYGVWGGLDADEIRAINRRKARRSAA